MVTNNVLIVKQLQNIKHKKRALARMPFKLTINDSYYNYLAVGLETKST